MKIWLVGTPLQDGRWMIEAASELESDAVKLAKEGEFIVLVDTEGRFPANAMDAEKIYFPCEETWETSFVYKARNK